jgi:IS30 family transposase
MARKRREYTAAERKELWQRWKQGEPIKDIAQTLDRAPGTIHNTIRKRGGVAPPERRRSRLALRLTEREEISHGIASGESARTIAARLGDLSQRFTDLLGQVLEALLLGRDRGLRYGPHWRFLLSS